MSTLLVILLTVSFIFVLGFIIIYNRLISLLQNRKNAYSNIDVQLKQRADLVPQLVNSVKGYAAHEKTVLTQVTDARTKIKTSGTIQERAIGEEKLSGSLINLFAVAENYPELKADKNFQVLQMELSDIENKIAASRRFFNSATSEYNSSTQQFPAIFIARIFGFQTEAFFEIPDTDRTMIEKAPDVSF